MTEKKILVVDDEEIVRTAMRRTLEKCGYSVQAASSGSEALETLSKDVRIDLVISDHLMPRMNGLDLLKQVKNLYPDAMRILMTGYADVDMAIRAINEGEIYRFVTKPWDNADLEALLALAFEQHDINRENRRLASLAQRRGDTFAGLEASHPGIGLVCRDASGAIVITEDEIRELLNIASPSAEAIEDCTAINDLLLAAH